MLVEDSDEDYATFVRALSGHGINRSIRRCTRGEEALDYLNRRGRFAGNAPRPSLILLDLNMPSIDGRELLAEVKHDDRFKEIPVVVITTSSNPKDVTECYRNGANSYQLKTIDYEMFKQQMQLLVEYWLNTCLLPSDLEDK